MSRDMDQSSFSELESEYELEMDTEFENDDEYEGEAGDEEYEGAGDYETDEEFEFEMSDGEGSDYAQRFHELAQMEFESESELDQEVNGLLNEMEQDFFWGSLKRFAKKRAGGLLKKAGKFALSKVPGGSNALGALTQLARGNLKGALGGLGKMGLKALMASNPAFAAAMPVLQNLGFESSEPSHEAWNNYVDVAREAYENLAENLHENMADPRAANQAANAALQTALASVGNRVAGGRGRRSGRGGGSARPRGRRIEVLLGPGEYLVVKRKRR